MYSVKFCKLDLKIHNVEMCFVVKNMASERFIYFFQMFWTVNVLMLFVVVYEQKWNTMLLNKNSWFNLITIVTSTIIIITNCICFDGVFIAAQCTATFLRSIVLPRIWVLGCEYAN